MAAAALLRCNTPGFPRPEIVRAVCHSAQTPICAVHFTSLA